MLWLTIIVFVGLLLLLVLAHEWGHFITARWAGCKVNEFAFGFPPRLWSFTKGDTKYSFNLLPLGGYVKIEGEDGADQTPGPNSFTSKSARWRVFILSAGVIMNVIVAVILLSFQAGIGVPTLVTEENLAQVADVKTFIVEVAPGSPAEAAGIQSLDRIVRLGQVSDPNIDVVRELVAAGAGQSIDLEVERAGVHHEIQLVPRADPPPGEGAMGVGLQEAGLIAVPWWKAPWAGVVRTWDMLSAIVVQFGLLIGRLFSGGSVGETLTGPVGIAVFANEVTNLGFSYILEFGALISLNLAIINILPFPALDGGRIFFIGLEKVAGRRVPVKFEQYTHLAGFALLILLMLVITFKDITRFF